MPKKEIKKHMVKRENRMSYHKSCGGVYFIGFVGAAIYYIQQSTGFWSGFLGIIKALFWPAFLVFKLLGM